MKRLLLAALTTLFAVTAHAEDNVPTYNACGVWLGEAVQINGLSYVPVHVANDYLLDIRSVFGLGDFVPDLELTGTVQPAGGTTGIQGHLNGNYWPYSSASISHAMQPYNPGFGDWTLDIFGSYDQPREGGADCSSLPYQTSGILCYLHFIGEGTVRLTRSQMLSGDACDSPGIQYYGYNVGTNTVQFPSASPPPPPPDDPPGCNFCFEGKTAAKPTSWGRLKAFYR